MHIYKIFSYRNENRHSTSFTKYKDNIFTMIFHEDTWALHYWSFFLVSSLFTLTGSGSGSLDGIPGSLDGLHKTSWNSLIKDLVADNVPTLSSAVGCLWLTVVDHTMVVSFWNFLWILRFVAQVSSTCREEICMKFSACGLLVLSPCVSEYMMLLLNWWLVNTRF